MMRCALIGIIFLVGSGIHLAFSTEFSGSVAGTRVEPVPNNELALISELRLIMCEYYIGIADIRVCTSGECHPHRLHSYGCNHS